MMKKMCVLGLFALVSSLVACYDGTANQKVTVTSDYRVGIGNYDFTGKTISNVTTTYITKTQISYSYSGTSTTASSSTEVITKTPYQIETSTITFNSDGTFTAINKLDYATGLNSGFMPSTSVDTSGRTTASISYYTAALGTFTSTSVLAVAHTGLDGQNVETYTIAGTWEKYYDVDSTGVETLIYKLKPQSRKEAINTISISSTANSAISITTSAARTFTYSDDGTTDFDAFAYSWYSNSSSPVFLITLGTSLSSYLVSNDYYTLQ